MTEGSRRSDSTRAKILAAARERFAARGYERATIRAIAQDAGIDPSMVMRYFGSKEGLFAAASEFDLRLPELSRLPRESVGKALVEHFLDRWEEDEVLTALLRAGVTNTAAAERMQGILREQVAPIAAAVSPDPHEAARRAVLVASQILGMAMTRYVLRFPPAVAMTRGELVEWVAPTVQRYLTASRAQPWDSAQDDGDVPGRGAPEEAPRPAPGPRAGE
ncbi:TetR family transcriptional regulator [Streptomyces sp. DW4-2]|uniref:TetR family transcriptional regulator n=1 Tax=Streptomyces spirodelae TaxID=2812904 RepID=A0ABS3WV40_9ACTN|nr:TetR family transcriptional regulator [Streptomyces spirodelae]